MRSLVLRTTFFLVRYVGQGERNRARYFSPLVHGFYGPRICGQVCKKGLTYGERVGRGMAAWGLLWGLPISIGLWIAQRKPKKRSNRGLRDLLVGWVRVLIAKGLSTGFERFPFMHKKTRRELQPGFSFGFPFYFFNSPALQG